MFGYLALSLLLTGCPEPVGSNGSATSDKSDPGAGQNPTDPSGDAVKPHTMGTCSGDGSGEQTDPKFTQTQLADGGLITGYVQCPKKCMGQILINAMNPPPLDDSQTQPKEEMNRLITQTIIEESAIEKKDNFSTRFSIRVPNKTRIQLQVVDDANKDGFCSDGESFGIRGSGPINVDGTAENIELTVGVFPQQDMTGSMNNTDQNVPPTPTTQPSDPPAQNIDAPSQPTQATDANSGDGPPPDDN